jgi:DNA/RNA-binding domain of Phe-tRNA-synthetase-like protein
MPLTVTDRLDDPRLRLGAVMAEGVRTDAVPEGFEATLAGVLDAREQGLSEALEARRQAARDALRHGAYKPTGRAKPAAEYLLRAAAEGTFPRVNAPVDVCNALSLDALVPISLWDLDLAAADAFIVRRGRPGESYVFNTAGQEIALDDLVLGARAHDDAPLVTPVKDGLATKTTPATTRVAGLVYAPAAAVSEAQLSDLLTRFAGWLGGCGPDARAAWARVPAGGTATIAP